MTEKKESLQKLTEYEIAEKELFEQEKITLDDIRNKFQKKEDRDAFTQAVVLKNKNLKGEEKDLFNIKIEQILPEETKNRLWEYNHAQITWAISNLMQECGRMPSCTEIAIKAELSRQTVHKHLKEYIRDERFLEWTEQFQFMTSKVLARVFKFAINGDIKAAKLYFEVVGSVVSKSSSNPTTNTQNNYIQINQLKITQEELKQLKPEQLQRVERFIKTVCSGVS